MQHLFCWARGLLVGTKCRFWWHVALVKVGTQLLDWWAPGISFGVHGEFLWPPGILMGTYFYFW